MTLFDEKLKFEQDIVEVLIKHGFVSRKTIIGVCTIKLSVDLLPVVVIEEGMP